MTTYKGYAGKSILRCVEAKEEAGSHSGNDVEGNAHLPANLFNYKITSTPSYNARHGCVITFKGRRVIVALYNTASLVSWQGTPLLKQPHTFRSSLPTIPW